MIVAAAVVILAPQAAAGPGRCDASWVGSFAAAPGFANPVPALKSTVRAIVSPHLGATLVRLRFSNRFGATPLTIGSVYLGRSVGGSSTVRAGTNMPVAFHGAAAVTIPAGGEVTSDDIRLTFAAFEPLAVSMYIDAATVSTEHFDAHQLSWMAPGINAAAADSGLYFPLPYPTLPLLTGVDVAVPGSGRTVVTLGDSITDGYHNLSMEVTTLGANQRYPDDLARRIAAAGGVGIGVVNAGVSGNQLTRDGMPVVGPLLGFGPAGLGRFDTDVLAVPGVTDVVVLEGTNDLFPILEPPRSPQQVIAGLRQLIARAHAAGVRVHLGTLSPRADNLVPPDRTGDIGIVNDWIRRSAGADSVADFAAALADPTDPLRIDPRFDSGDQLHPNPAGYQAMADAVDLAKVLAPPAGGWRCDAVSTTA